MFKFIWILWIELLWVKLQSVWPQLLKLVAEVELLLPGKRFASVPELALQWRKGESFIWLVTDGAAQKTLVTTVKRLNAVVLVDGKVKPGDQVIVEGVQRLRPGRKVRFEPAGQPPSKPGGDISAKPKVSTEG